MMHLDSLLDNLLALRPEDRPSFFSMRSDAEREAIMVLWAQSPRLRVTDIVALPQPYQAELISFVVGDPQKGRPGTKPIFVLEPTGEPVRVEAGTMNNKRQFRSIRGRTPLAADQAIHAMLCYGPFAELDSARGQLQEVEEEVRETSKARTAREAYLSLGPGRTLKQVSEELYPAAPEHPTPHILRWSEEHNWPPEG